MNFDQTINLILPLLSRDSTDVKELRDVIARLFREDITTETLIDFINERRHEREAQDLPDLPTVGDLTGFLRSLLEPTDDNRERWVVRFKSGHAQYLCPECGYAGDGDDFKTPDSGSSLVCGACGCLKDRRYFTRSWSSDEQAAYEAEQARLRPLVAARDKREIERRDYAVALEPKVKEVLAGLEGVGGYENFAEDQAEVGPLVRAVVHASTLTADAIVSEWKQHAATHELIAQFTRLTVHEFAAGMILGEFSMKEVLDNIDNFEASELEPLEAGEERFVFTRDEFIHEMTVNIAKWDKVMDTRELSTALGPDGKFAITVHAKGYAEAHPCLCADCKAVTESNPTKAGSRVQ